MSRLFPSADPMAADPVRWAKERADVWLWSKQQEIVESVRDHRYTAVRSCHGAGKSFTAALVLAHWLDTHPLNEVFVVWTAPRWPQVQAIIGRELRSLHQRIGLDGRITLDCQVYMGDDVLVGFGRKPADTDEHGFQGIHAKHVLIVVDESCGIPKALFTAAMSLMTSDNCHILGIGNPDDPASEFETFFSQDQSAWNQIHIDGLLTPNFTEAAVAQFPRLHRYMVEQGIPFSTEYVPDHVRPLLLTPQWAAEALDRWGPNSALFTSKVRGCFPEVSNDTLYPPALIHACHEVELVGSQKGQLAYDIARLGPDETVGYHNRGGVVRVVHSANKQDTMQTAGAIARQLIDLDHRVSAWVDADGLGAGVFDRLVEQGLPVYAWHGGQPPMDRERFVNRRAEAYWYAREQMLQGLVDLDPEDDLLESQLRQIKFKLDSQGRIKIESKDEMARRGLKSPDRADAFVMSLWMAPAHQTLASAHAAREIRTLTGDLLDRPM